MLRRPSSIPYGALLRRGRRRKHERESEVERGILVERHAIGGRVGKTEYRNLVRGRRRLTAIETDERREGTDAREWRRRRHAQNEKYIGPRNSEPFPHLLSNRLSEADVEKSEVIVLREESRLARQRVGKVQSCGGAADRPSGQRPAGDETIADAGTRTA